MRVIAVVNQKGGCGKTTTTINLAAFLATAGRKTLVIDMDPQGHATLGLLRTPAPATRTIYDVLLQHTNGRETRLSDVTQSVQTNLDIVPADILLSALPENVAGVRGRERLLVEVLDDVGHRYDYVFIDCPPQVGVLTFNALFACSEAIVPVDPSFFSLHGIGRLMETFDVLARQTGHQIAVRALVTMYSGRTRFAREVVDEIRRHFAGRHFETIIRHSVKLAEAASHGVPIAAYRSHCAGFDDYQALAAEVLASERVRPADEAGAVREEAAVALPSAPRVTSEGVVFAIEAPDAQRVQLVGDFNGWTLEGGDMRRVNTVWTCLLTLAPGRYSYRYVIDGQWQNDPLNTEVEPTPYGGCNSVFTLEAAVSL